MNKLLLFFISISTLLSFVPTTNAAGLDAKVKQQIVEPVTAYFSALNTSDQKTIMALYSKTPTFMQQGAPAFVGRTAVDRAYIEIFKLLNLNVSYDIEEVKMLSPTTALVRTHSTGTAHFKPDKTSRNEGSNELFILNLEGEKWKIGHYIFSADHR